MKLSFDLIMEPLDKLIHRGATPERVAGGFALGLFIGSFPGPGLQMAAAAFFATIFRLNIVAACMAVWYTNPWTWAPITYFEYWIGAKVMGVEMLTFGEIKNEVLFGMRNLFGDPGAVWIRVMEMSQHFWAMMLGCFILGLALAAVSYPPLVALLRRVQRKRKERRDAKLAAPVDASGGSGDGFE